MNLSAILSLAVLGLSARHVLGGGGFAADVVANDDVDKQQQGSLRRGLSHCDVYTTIGCQCLNGIYCGQNFESTGVDPDKFEPNTLYDCHNGCYTVKKDCGDHQYCSFEPCKHDDVCKSGTAPSPGPGPTPTPDPECPNGTDGAYCGNNPDVPHYLPGRDEAPVDGRLYYCKDGHYSKIDTCTNNHPAQVCKVVGGGHDVCVDAAPSPGPGPTPTPDPHPCLTGNKHDTYCGNNQYIPPQHPALLDGVLYTCEDGVYTVEDYCDMGEECVVSTHPGDDECVKVPTASPSAKPSASPSQSAAPTVTASESPSAAPSLSDYNCDDNDNLGKKCIVTGPYFAGKVGVCVKKDGFPNDASHDDDGCCPTSVLKNDGNRKFIPCAENDSTKGFKECCNTISQYCDTHKGECKSKW